MSVGPKQAGVFVHGSQMMNPNDFSQRMHPNYSETLTLPPAPYFDLLLKYFETYGFGMKILYIFIVPRGWILKGLVTP